MKIFGNRKLALFVAISLLLSALPFSEPAYVVHATESVAESSMVNTYVVNEDYNSKAGSGLADTAENGYTWTLAGETEEAVVVSKADAIGGDANDYCVKLPSTVSGDKNEYILRIDEAIALENSEYSESNLVVEVDVAFVGTMVGNAASFVLADNGGTNETLLQFNATNNAVSSTYADRWMRIYSSALSYVGPSIDKGVFGTLKMVVNRGGTSTSTSCSYYWNDQLVEETIYFQNSSQKSKAAASSFKKYNGKSVVEFDEFKIQVPKCDEGEDVAVFIDDLKIYTEGPAPTATPAEPTEAPTAAPTEAPTAEPTAEPTEAPAPTEDPADANRDYSVDEDFDDFEPEKALTDIVTGDAYSWTLTGTKVRSAIKVKSDITGNENDSADKVLWLGSSASTAGSYRLDLTKAIELENADLSNSNLVIEMDVALKGEGIDAEAADFEFRNSASTSFLRFDILNDVMTRRYSDSSSSTYYSGPSITKGEFVNFKVVINRGTDEKSCSYYWGNELVAKSIYSGDSTEKDESSFKKITNATELGNILITVPKLTADEELYIDNLKIYTEEIPAPTATPVAPTEAPTAAPTEAPTAAPTEAPTAAPTEAPTAEPTAEPTEAPAPTEDPADANRDYSIKESFDDITVNKVFNTIATRDGYTLEFTGRTGNSKIVAKTGVDENASADDLCLLLASAGAAGYYTLKLDESIALGEEALSGSNIVIEMDVALTGTTTSKSPMATIWYGMAPVASNPITRLNLSNVEGTDQWVRLNKSFEYAGPAIERGSFTNLKVVINRGTEDYCCSYYWDGELAEEPYKKDLNWAGTAFDVVRFDIPVQVDGEDLGIYIDNLKVYTEEIPAPTATPVAPTEAPTAAPTEAPTAAPTEAPTAAPTEAPTAEPTAEPTEAPAPTEDPADANRDYSIKESFDDITVNKVFNTIATRDGYTLEFTGRTGNSKIVAKTGVDENASADDLCLLLASAGAAGYYTLKLDESITLGEEALSGSNIVIEMDVALTGTTTSKSPMATIWYGMAPVASNPITRLNLSNIEGTDQWVRLNKSFEYAGPAIERGSFTNLKVVINRGTEDYCCSYYWDGELAEEPYKKDLNWTGTAFDVVRFDIPVKVDGEDLGIYIDNLKVYTEEIPAPTATPVAPTEAPTEAPTAAPTEAPTADPNATASPIKIDLDFDDVEEGTLVKEFEAGDIFTWVTAGSVGNGKVVSKADVITGANAEDYCLVLTGGTTQGGTYIIRFNEDACIPLEDQNLSTSNLVIEMDVALKGSDTTKSPIANFYFGNRNTNPVESQLLKLSLQRGDNVDQWVRIDGGTKGSEITTGTAYVGTTLERGNFAKLKIVVNRGTDANCMSYYWDGQLVESNLTKDSQWASTGFGEIKFVVPIQAADVDVKMYVDNIKVYTEEVEVEASPEPTEPVLPPDEGVAFGKKNLVLNDAIAVNFHMIFPEGITTEEITNNYRMKFTLSNGKVSYDEECQWKNGAPYYTCNVFASEMSETITAQLFKGDATTPVVTCQYSVKEYCNSQLDNEENQGKTELLDLIETTMQYGSMSQLYFGGKAMDGVEAPVGLDSNALAELTATYPRNTPSPASNDKISLSGMTLVLFSETALRAGFEFKTKPDSTDLYTFDDFDIEAYNITKDETKTLAGTYTGIYKGDHYFDIPGITPDALNDNYRIVVKHNGESILTMEYSPFTYISRKLADNTATDELKNVVTAMYRYNKAAEAYVAQPAE